jgi:micrococcal nuclease
LSARIEGAEVRLGAIEYGKYAGRVVARVTMPDGEDLAAGLIAAGLGRAYEGGARVGWCDGADASGEREAELAKASATR